jgi:hypothetical protein
MCPTARSRLQALCMIGCNQHTITDQAFQHLTGLAYLDVTGCDQLTEQAQQHLLQIAYVCR